jgi:hypothetical protein
MLQPSTAAQFNENIVHRLPLMSIPWLQPIVLLHVRALKSIFSQHVNIPCQRYFPEGFGWNLEFNAPTF